MLGLMPFQWHLFCLYLLVPSPFVPPPRPFQYASHAAEVYSDAYYYADGDRQIHSRQVVRPDRPIGVCTQSDLFHG